MFFLHRLVAIEDLKLFSSKPNSADKTTGRDERVVLLRQVQCLLLLLTIHRVRRRRRRRRTIPRTIFRRTRRPPFDASTPVEKFVSGQTFVSLQFVRSAARLGRVGFVGSVRQQRSPRTTLDHDLEGIYLLYAFIICNINVFLVKVVFWLRQTHGFEPTIVS